MSFAAREWRTAAAVARSRSKNLWADEWDKKADELEKRETYAADLGDLFKPGDSAFYLGARVLLKLLEDGWESPEGLL